MWSPGVEPDWRKQVYEVERQCLSKGKGHVFVHLTRNPHGIEPEYWNLPNQWIGVSSTGKNAPDLLSTLAARCGPAAHRWVSFEPLLSKVYPSRVVYEFSVEFVVIGGLSDGKRIVPPTEPGGLKGVWADIVLVEACRNRPRAIFCKNLHPDVWKRMYNPRTGGWMQGPCELRELPPEWEALRRKGANIGGDL